MAHLRPPSPALTATTDGGAQDFYEAQSNQSIDSFASVDTAGTQTPRRQSFQHSQMSRDAFESAVSLPYQASNISITDPSQVNNNIDTSSPQQPAAYTPIELPSNNGNSYTTSHEAPTSEIADSKLDQQTLSNHVPPQEQQQHVERAATEQVSDAVPEFTGMGQPAALNTFASAVPALMPHGVGSGVPDESTVAQDAEKARALPHDMPEKNEKRAEQDMAPEYNEKTGKRASGSGGSNSSDTAVNVGDEYAHLPPEQAELLRNQAAVPPERTVKFMELFRFHTKFEHTVNLLALIFAVASGVAIPAQMLIFGNLTSDFTSFGATGGAQSLEAIENSLLNSVDRSALILFGIGLAVWFSMALFGAVWTYTGETAARRMREAYLRSVLRQNVAFHDKVGSGEIATQIINNTHLVQEAFSEKVAITVNLLGTFFAGFVIAFVVNWRIALVTSVIVPLIGGTGFVMNFFLMKFKKQSLDYVSTGGTIAEEAFTSVRIVQSFGIQYHLARLYAGINDKTAVIGRKSALVNAIGLACFFSVMYLAYSLTFWFGITMFLENNATSGEIVTCFFAIVIGSFSLVNITPNLTAFTSGISAAGKLFDTIDRQPPIDSSSEKGEKPSQVYGDIEFNNINFFYPSRPTVQVLYNFTATFPRGKHTALVGASGSGKSSILALIERWYEPISGSIKLDGNETRDLHIKWMRSQIGLVSQEPVLMNLTVYENIVHGLINTPHEDAAPEKKREMVEEAAKAANAYNFIEKLPEKWETRLGERGSLVSGGQKQRICIARALISNPSILLLDEATSALDTTSEKLVQEALDKASTGRTTISIAHRLSTIKDADQIIVMNAGRVVEKGDHHSLIAQNGAYKKLVDAQAFIETEGAEDALPTKEEAKKEEAEGFPGDTLKRTATSKSVASSAYGEAHAEERKRHNLGYLFKRMYQINKDQRLSYAIGFLGATASGMVFPVFSIIFGTILGVFSETDRDVIRSDGNRGALYFLILAIVATFAITAQTYFLNLAAETLATRLRKQTFSSVLRQDIKYFDVNTSGALTSRISELPQKIFGLAGSTLGLFVQSGIVLLAGYIIGLAYAPKVAAVGIACAPLNLISGYARLRFVVMRDQTNKKDHEESAQLAAESAGAIRTISSLTREDECLRMYSKALEGPEKKALKAAIISNIILGFVVGVGFFTIALIFYYGARQLIDGLAPSNFFIALSATIFGTTQAGSVFQYSPDFSKALAAADELVYLYENEVEIDADSKEGVVLPDVKGHIVLQDVHFRYPTRPDVPVLRGLNLECKPGQFIALVGESGCGKSTTTALLERFYDPLKGKVTIDGQDISEMNVTSYRSHLALVSQEPTLFAGSVRFNVLLGAVKDHSEVTEEEIVEACRKANILDFVKSLPDGFDTEVGNKGVSLSGGQKQRLAIARALIRNPRVLILDEATSALDSSSERVVQAALDEAAKGRSTVSIAHRLTTIQHADCIYVFAKGRVVEQGNHTQLMGQKGLYAELVQKQAVTPL